MNPKLIVTLIFSAAILPATSFAESLPSHLIGRVTVRSTGKLDAKGARELVTIAKKIQQSGTRGAIIISGDVAAAKSQEDYLLKAVFTARAVQRQLTPLLASQYQTFVTAAEYAGKYTSTKNSVAIHLYPHELEVMEAALTPLLITPQELSTPTASVSDQPARAGLLTPPPADDDRREIASKKETVKEHREDPVLANELVLKAKARAAVRARQLERMQ